jgi:hypothetical protein
MRILVFWDKKTWETKMSSVRRHGINAIARYPGVELKMSGPGWPGFKNCRYVEKKFKPDIILWYKPLDMGGYNRVNAPRSIRYNELWDKKWSKKEIEKSKSSLVICHHFNDIERYKGVLDPKVFKLIHNPHCSEVEIFKDYELEKDIDVILVGTMAPRSCYPLRYKFGHKVKQELKRRGVNFKTYKHPGYRIKGLTKIDNQVKRYAKMISRAKIAVTDASDFHYALAKYTEIPLCRTALCGDIPRENEEWYKKWVISVDKDNNAVQIADVICHWLENDRWKKKADLGYKLNMECRKQEDYARRFVAICQDYLDGKLNDYDFTKDSGKYLNGGDGGY